MQQINAASVVSRKLGPGSSVICRHAKVGIGSNHAEALASLCIAVLFDPGLLAFISEQQLFRGSTAVDGCGDAGSFESFEVIRVYVGQEIEQRFVEVSLCGLKGQTLAVLSRVDGAMADYGAAVGE
jgi:hypothetical protein